MPGLVVKVRAEDGSISYNLERLTKKTNKEVEELLAIKPKVTKTTEKALSKIQKNYKETPRNL